MFLALVSEPSHCRLPLMQPFQVSVQFWEEQETISKTVSSQTLWGIHRCRSLCPTQFSILTTGSCCQYNDCKFTLYMQHSSIPYRWVVQETAKLMLVLKHSIYSTWLWPNVRSAAKNFTVHCFCWLLIAAGRAGQSTVIHWRSQCSALAALLCRGILCPGTAGFWSLRECVQG